MFKYRLVEDSKITGYVKSSYFYFEAHYRWRDAIIASIHFDMDSMGLGISYDLNVSDLTPASSLRGGFEVSLRFHSLSGYMFSPSERFSVLFLAGIFCKHNRYNLQQYIFLYHQ
jgi:hypothetical protein